MPELESDRPPLAKLTLCGHELDLERYLSGEYLDVAQACEELPPIIEWVNETLQEAVLQKLRAARKSREIWAKTFIGLRNGGYMEIYGAEKKPTETTLEYATTLDAAVQAASATTEEWTAYVRRLEGVLRSLHLKLDLIRTVESTRRSLFNSTELGYAGSADPRRKPVSDEED